MDPQAFLGGWRSLPAEIRLDILSYVLVIPKTDIRGAYLTAADYTVDRHSRRLRGRFYDVALPLLACPEMTHGFNVPQAAFDIWYGQNKFFCGLSNRMPPNMLYYRYLTPPRRAFAHLQHLKVYVRGNYIGWDDLARYCKATKSMPMLKMFELEFVFLSDERSLKQAFKGIGPLVVSTQKLVVDYHGVDQLFFPARTPVQNDCVDYPHAAVVFGAVGIEILSGKTMTETFERRWDDCLKKFVTGDVWVLPPPSKYQWHKHIVRTQWL